jgi:hypothetical protein
MIDKYISKAMYAFTHLKSDTPLSCTSNLRTYRFFALIMITIMSGGGCDDEVPDVPEIPQVRTLRDASMELMPFDYSTGGEDQVADLGMGGQLAGSTGGDSAGQVSGDSGCAEGDTRPKSACGLERCVDGAWSIDQDARERCNDHDDDCDGRIDESFSIGGMCFIDNAQGCRLEGEYQCDPNTEAAMCMTTSATSMRPELCDGIDNDCDDIIDEGFEDGPQCCSDPSHCPAGFSCAEGTCEDMSSTRPDINPNAPLGTCGQPVWMPGFNVYPTDGNIAQKELAVANCTGDLLDDLLLLGQTVLGSEVVFAFSLPQTQRVRFSVELTLFASVIYVFEGQCNQEMINSAYCDQSILGLASEPARSAELIFEAQANQVYYVVLDTKLDLVELMEITGGGDLGAIPFVLSFSAAP